MKFSIPPHGTPGLGGAGWIRVEGVRAAGKDLPPVHIRLGLGDDGRLVATGLLIEANGELTTRELRLPLARIVSLFAAATEKPATYKRLVAERDHPGRDFDKDPRWRDWTPDTAKGAFATDFVPVPWEGPRPEVQTSRPGRRGHPDEHYRKIARAYTIAKRKYPKNPVQKLMEATGTPGHPRPEATVHRWIREARKRGFLKED